MESIENKVPVIAYGVIGPPDEGIVAGYDKDGHTLYGRSFHHNNSDEYYKTEHWYNNCLVLLVLEKRYEPPEKHYILKCALNWAVTLANSVDVRNINEYSLNSHFLGFAAFKSWINDLKNDAFFPNGNINTLTMASKIHSDVTLASLIEARNSGVLFLKSMINEIPAARSDISNAVNAYEEELTILHKGLEFFPFSYQTDKQRLRIADPGLRSQMANLVTIVLEKEKQAIGHIELALKKI